MKSDKILAFGAVASLFLGVYIAFKSHDTTNSNNIYANNSPQVSEDFVLLSTKDNNEQAKYFDKLKERAKEIMEISLEEQKALDRTIMPTFHEWAEKMKKITNQYGESIFPDLKYGAPVRLSGKYPEHHCTVFFDDCMFFYDAKTNSEGNLERRIRQFQTIGKEGGRYRNLMSLRDKGPEEVMQYSVEPNPKYDGIYVEDVVDRVVCANIDNPSDFVRTGVHYSGNYGYSLPIKGVTKTRIDNTVETISPSNSNFITNYNIPSKNFGMHLPQFEVHVDQRNGKMVFYEEDANNPKFRKVGPFYPEATNVKSGNSPRFPVEYLKDPDVPASLSNQMMRLLKKIN
jgi:hypothetical protein